MTTQEPIEQRIDRIQNGGIIDLHFDLLMDLYEKRQRKSVLETEFLPELEVGNVGVVGVAIYIENRYLPDSGLRVALDQIARLYAETQACSRFAISKSYHDKAADCFAHQCPALLRYRAQHQRRADQNDRGTARCDWNQFSARGSKERGEHLGSLRRSHRIRNQFDWH